MTPPRSLHEWTVDEVARLVEQGAHETEYFDFKERLPDPRSDGDKHRLATTCAAFANSGGGFVVFGVRDDRSEQASDRLVGVDASLDFPEHFGNFAARCSPSVVWTFANPPLRLPSGNVIHIVEISQSWSAPHAVGHPGSWGFPKRTNKGNEWMSYSEVQLMFLGYYEKRIKLQLLRGELQQIQAEAAGLIVSPANESTQYGMASIDLTVLETVIADTYSVTYRSPNLVAMLTALRSKARIVNNKTSQFRSFISLPMGGKDQLVKEHNEFVRPHCTQIVHLVQQILPLVDELAG